MISLFATMPLFWVGVGLFTYFGMIAPEPCPKKYMTTKKLGGELENAGDIYNHCTPDANWAWKLKTNTVTFEEILNGEKN
tara:strand:+ start:83 stop:322 length:240 start_codon:yes stop_codon:yes gene_type:complete